MGRWKNCCGVSYGLRLPYPHNAVVNARMPGLPPVVKCRGGRSAFNKPPPVHHRLRDTTAPCIANVPTGTDCAQHKARSQLGTWLKSLFVGQYPNLTKELEEVLAVWGRRANFVLKTTLQAFCRLVFKQREKKGAFILRQFFQNLFHPPCSHSDTSQSQNAKKRIHLAWNQVK